MRYLLIVVIAISACDSPDSTPESVADTLPQDSVQPEVSSDTGARDTRSAGQAPIVRGPDPALYDCTHDPTRLPGRVSPVSLGCLRDPSCEARQIVGHRATGGAFGAIAPENSLSAIRAAIVMGVDGVELDVRLSSDEVLVLMHDGTIDRTTEETGAVGTFTAAELSAIALTQRDVLEGDHSCDRIPLLSEAFELTRGRLVIHIDAKTSRTDLIAQAIADAEMLDQVIISTNSVDEALLARLKVPEVMVQVRPDSEAEVDAVLEIFSERAPEIFEIPSGIAPTVRDRVRAAGGKLLANAWDADVTASITGELTGYTDLFDRGLDLLQVELVPYALESLGR